MDYKRRERLAKKLWSTLNRYSSPWECNDFFDPTKEKNMQRKKVTQILKIIEADDNEQIQSYT